jgi:site-specific recombinase XerC
LVLVLTRVSEIIGVRLADVVLEGAACVHLHGKGRKQRTMPLWRSTVKAVRSWLRFNPDLLPASALLPNSADAQDCKQRSDPTLQKNSS